jgi:hypothetical protein
VNVGAPIRLVLALAALLAGDGAITRADTHTLTDVMRRAHQYVVLYEDHELSTVIGREQYQQQWLDSQARTKAERTLTSDYLLFQLPPSEDGWRSGTSTTSMGHRSSIVPPGRISDDALPCRRV